MTKLTSLVLGNLLTESHLLRGFRKYIILGVLREIRMKLLFRLGKANLPKELENPLNMSQMLRGFQKYTSLRVLRNIRLKLISRLGKVNLLSTW